jgi:DNA polymerase-3 subunit gamma/tau
VDTVRRLWPDVLDKLRSLRRVTWSLVSEYAQVLDLDGGRLVILFDSPGRAASFGKGAHAEYLRQSLIEVIGLDCRIEAVSGDAAQARAARPAPPPPAPPSAPRPDARPGAWPPGPEPVPPAGAGSPGPLFG